MADTFIDCFIEHTKMYESSTAFWKWAGFAAISGVLRDHIYWAVGDDRTYPNIYVLLLAVSGAHRKGKPIRTANKLVEEVNNTKIISGRTSVQAIFEEMMSSETDPNTGRLSKGGAAILFAEELAAGIVSDEQGVAILTDIYDYKMNFKVNLVSRGKRKIEQMVFSLLAGSNEDLLKGVYTASAVNGGLLARTFLITPDEFRPSNSLMNIGNTQDSFKNLVCKLREISKLSGFFTFTEKAWKEYEDWYMPFRNSQKERVDRTGVLGRIHTGIVKIAMILAANELSKEINHLHIEESIDLCLKLIPNYNSFTMLSGKSDIAQAGAMVIADLKSAPGYTLSRKILIRRHWMDFTMETLDQLVTSLETAGLLKQGLIKNEATLSLTTKMIEMIEGKE